MRKLKLHSVAPSWVTGDNSMVSPQEDDMGDYVPGRNIFLLTAAANYAVEVKASYVVLGFHKPFQGGKMPKDQSLKFLQAMTALMRTSLDAKHTPQFIAPFMRYMKTSIVRVADELDLPVEKLRTCYAATARPCHKCGACEALEDAVKRKSLTKLKDIGSIEDVAAQQR